MEFLPVNVQKGLSDKLYEKRKQAALEIEKMVKERNADFDYVTEIINQLTSQFCYSSTPNSRSGALVAYAAISMAISDTLNLYLPLIVPPIIRCLSDNDARVRYYACESLYNVSKVARNLILYYFNEIFDSLCKLSVDVEQSVKNGAELVDRLIKDIVTESSKYYHPEFDGIQDASIETPGLPPFVPGTTSPKPGMDNYSFNLGRFIPLLSERVKIISPNGRMFLVQWLAVLHSKPELELIQFIPEFLNV
jgi:vacuole morphology and inheritance protein 14